jgi:NDP-sugar pyrophosphorylase family protein
MKSEPNPDLQGITGVVLAGGLGTRLRAEVPDKSKVLAPVRGRPFVTYVLDQLCAAGVQTIVLCTGYLADQIEQYLGPEYRGVRLRYSREETPLGTAGALRLALPLLNSDCVLVANGDSYCAVDLGAMAQQHRRRRAAGTIAVAAVEDTRRFGSVEIAADGQVVRFMEKAAAAGAGWINAGIYLLQRSLVEAIPPMTPLSLERDLFPGWTSQGLYAFLTSARLWDIGVPEAFRQAQTAFAAE